MTRWKPIAFLLFYIFVKPSIEICLNIKPLYLLLGISKCLSNSRLRYPEHLGGKNFVAKIIQKLFSN